MLWPTLYLSYILPISRPYGCTCIAPESIRVSIVAVHSAIDSFGVGQCPCAVSLATEASCLPTGFQRLKHSMTQRQATMARLPVLLWSADFPRSRVRPDVYFRSFLLVGVWLMSTDSLCIDENHLECHYPQKQATEARSKATAAPHLRVTNGDKQPIGEVKLTSSADMVATPQGPRTSGVSGFIPLKRCVGESINTDSESQHVQEPSGCD